MLIKRVPSTHVVINILIATDPEAQHDRIALRGRPEEKRIDLAFLRELEGRYVKLYTEEYAVASPSTTLCASHFCYHAP